MLTKYANPRNMEPPEANMVIGVFNNDKRVLQVILHMPILFKPVVVIRLRGAGNNPNHDRNYNDIPYLTQRNFQWNCLPTIDFNERVLNLLNNGLGSVSIKSGTLLATVRETDPGGRLGNPMRAVAPQSIIDESMQRNEKAFSCIMNYLNPNSELYKQFMRDFQTDGIAVYTVILAVGPIAAPPRLLRSREDSWQRMTMDALKISYTVVGFFIWTETVIAQARVLNKDGVQQKDKFIDGLPAFFQSEKAQMRHDNRFVLPATYGGLPGFATSPIAARVHPHAGQPNIKRMSIAYLPDWFTKTANVKNTPDGMVRSVEEASSACIGCDEIAELLSSDQVTKSTKCFACGGEGHPARCTLPNGDTFTCGTLLLKNQTGRNDHNHKSSSSPSKHDKRVHELTHELEEMETRLEEAQRLVNTKSRDARRRPYRSSKPHSARPAASEATSDATDSQAEAEEHGDATSTQDGEEDESDSDGSTIHNFADQISKPRRFPRQNKH